MSLFMVPSADGGETTNSNIKRRVLLDGVSYFLTFKWNSRDEAWYVTVSLVGGVDLFTVKAATNRVFNDQYKYIEEAPQGNLMVVDTIGGKGRVDYENFTIDRRYRLFYLEAENLV